MLLLNPKKHVRKYPDERSREVMLKTIEFFETKGKKKLKEDDRERIWYSDFLEFVKKERIFATILTPSGYGAPDSRWDTWRNCEFAEILAFYGLHYWYTWQVSVLGLGPVWMSPNEGLKQRAARLLEEGGIFGFGLSERAHGADVYSTEMKLVSQGGGKYLARGDKYYIGNGNEAAMVSTFGKFADSGDYVFFAVDSQHPKFECVDNVINCQSYVSSYALHDYPIQESDILSRGQDAWNAALNTVNVGKFNLGWASIGICTHAFYEAITHASNRRLYGMSVTDFAHVKQLFTDAYSRLLAMKLVTLRAADYMRSASPDDRRYLLYNSVVKMKVTTEGEEVVNHLWDVIAAKGFEKDMYFEMATRDIRAMPKLEGTVHVNIALINKFMPAYFMNHLEYPPVPMRDDAANDAFLFRQGPAKGLGQVRFADYDEVLGGSDLPNVSLFRDQTRVFREMLEKATPGAGQANDVDFMLSLGEIFVLVVYGQLLLENSKIYGIGAAVIDQMFDVLVRDFSKLALRLYSKPTSSQAQTDYCLKMIRRPVVDRERYEGVWKDHVHSLSGLYEMNP
jgi:acyl-CoA dehydrogenase